MTLIKVKTPGFKNISNEMDTGGAPIYADDLLKIQDNASADVLNYYEDLRSRLDAFNYFQGIGNPVAPEFENGLILSGCQYDNTDPLNPVISAGYILSGGSVCYFAGGTFNTGGAAPGLIYLYKGAATYTSRVFNDGGNKQILETYTAVIEQGANGPDGPILPVATGIVPTDQVVVISCGTGSSSLNYAENFFSIPAALKNQSLGAKLNESVLTDVTLLNGSTIGQSGFMASRVTSDGMTEVIGSVVIPAGSQTGSNVVLFDLNAFDIVFGGSLPVFCGSTNQTIAAPLVSVNLFGNVRVQQPTAGWWGIDVEIVFSTKVFGGNSKPAPFQYDASFLNIT